TWIERSGDGCWAYPSMLTFMICDRLEPRAAGRMECLVRPVGSIAADGCRCLRWLDCRQRAGGHHTPQRAMQLLRRQRMQRCPSLLRHRRAVASVDLTQKFQGD